MPVSDLLLPLDKLPDPLPIAPLARSFSTVIRPPGSKSLTNRALLVAALAEGESSLSGALVDADDAQVMIRALRQLGARIDVHPGASDPDPDDASALPSVRVLGVGGRWAIPKGQEVRLDLHNAGTATRFLTAAALLAPPQTSIVIDGDARMRERPIGELVDALVSMGARVECLARKGYPPLRVHPADEHLKDTVEFGKTASSQFISALLLVAPFLPRGLRVRCRGHELTSTDYVHMTTSLVQAWGARGEPGQDAQTAVSEGLIFDWRIRPEHIRGRRYPIEADTSGASYFSAAAAMCPGATVTLRGVSGTGESLQGDVKFSGVLDMAGADVGCDDHEHLVVNGRASILPFDADFSDIPDTAMTGAVLACFAQPTADNPRAVSVLRGLRTLRVKETDRIAALETELAKLGAKVEVFAEAEDEGLRITPPPAARGGGAAAGAAFSRIEFDTYHDHRMAMSLALVGLRRPNVFIRDPGCVAKTYPTFWRDLSRLYAAR